MKASRIFRAFAIAVVAFATIMIIPSIDQTGFLFIALLLLSFFAVPYFLIALTPAYLPNPQAELIDVSPVALQAQRINAIPSLLRKLPTDASRTRTVAIGFILLGLIPLVAPLFFLSREGISWILSLSRGFELPAVFAVIVCNRFLRAGYGLLKLDGACLRVGWQPSEWRRYTQVVGSRVAADTIGEGLLRIFAIAFVMGALLLGITGGAIGGAIGGGAGYAIFLATMKLVTTSKARRLKAALMTQAPTDVGIHPIVYLRAFKDDGALSTPDPHSGRTLEEGLCLAACETNRRIVALGKPGEKLPPLGAERFYVTDEQWQQVIGEWMLRAHEIVMVASTTSATKWEKEEAQRLDCLSRLLILFALPSKERIAEVFARIQSMTGTLLHTPELDEKTTICGVYFTRDNQPRMIISTNAKLPDLAEAIKWHKHSIASAQ